MMAAFAIVALLLAAIGIQARQESHMIEMGVSQGHPFDVRASDRQGLPIPFAPFFGALEKTAIDEQFLVGPKSN